jgi:hypothetical protein
MEAGVVLPRCSRGWVLDAALLSSAGSGGGGRLRLFLGLSDNSVELWAIPDLCKGSAGDAVSRDCRIGRWECTERCLLYSIALKPPSIKLPSHIACSVIV